jgi:hypothetical protein
MSTKINTISTVRILKKISSETSLTPLLPTLLPTLCVFINCSHVQASCLCVERPSGNFILAYFATFPRHKVSCGVINSQQSWNWLFCPYYSLIALSSRGTCLYKLSQEIHWTQRGHTIQHKVQNFCWNTLRKTLRTSSTTTSIFIHNKHLWGSHPPGASCSNAG